MTPPRSSAVSLGTLLLASCTTAGMVVGRIVDAESKLPIPRARIVAPSLQLQIEADSAGRFSFTPPRTSGCYVFRAISFGYGPTYRSVRFPLTSGADLVIPLRESPIPESRGLYVQQCVPPDAVHALWGMDTVLVP